MANKLLEEMTGQELDFMIGSWIEHPITQYIQKIYKETLDDNLTNPSVDGVVNIEFTAGRLLGQNQIIYKLLNTRDWLKTEVEYNVFKEVK